MDSPPPRYLASVPRLLNCCFLKLVPSSLQACCISVLASDCWRLKYCSTGKPKSHGESLLSDLLIDGYWAA